MLFSRWVLSSILWPHGLQHARLPCPSLSPGVCSNSCSLSRWCHPTISSCSKVDYIHQDPVLKWAHFQRYLGLGFQCIFGRAKLNPWPWLNKDCGWNLGKEWRREGDESRGWVSGVGSCRLCMSKALLSEKRNLGPAFWQGILGSSTFQERRLREIWNLWNGQRRG